MMMPKYAQNIIVGIRTVEKFQWFITDRDMWILDIYKYQEAYERIGYKINLDFILSLRQNIDVVNSENLSEYLNPVKINSVNGKNLRELLLKKQYSETVLELNPALYIDFIDKKLYSMYPESIPFEKYVPDNWEGKCQDFTLEIPENERYWIYKEKNLIEILFKEEKISWERRKK